MDTKVILECKLIKAQHPVCQQPDSGPWKGHSSSNQSAIEINEQLMENLV